MKVYKIKLNEIRNIDIRYIRNEDIAILQLADNLLSHLVKEDISTSFHYFDLVKFFNFNLNFLGLEIRQYFSKNAIATIQVKFKLKDFDNTTFTWSFPLYKKENEN